MKARIALAGALLPLAACSYMQTKDVGDEYVQGTRAAVVVVLGDAGLATRAGPDCVVNDGATELDCTAQTTTGARVEAHASGGDSDNLDSADLTISVDGSVLYTGSVAAVLARENE